MPDEVADNRSFKSVLSHISLAKSKIVKRVVIVEQEIALVRKETFREGKLKLDGYRGGKFRQGELIRKQLRGES